MNDKSMELEGGPQDGITIENPPTELKEIFYFSSVPGDKTIYLTTGTSPKAKYQKQNAQMGQKRTVYRFVGWQKEAHHEISS